MQKYLALNTMNPIHGTADEHLMICKFMQLDPDLPEKCFQQIKHNFALLFFQLQPYIL